MQRVAFGPKETPLQQNAACPATTAVGQELTFSDDQGTSTPMFTLGRHAFLFLLLVGMTSFRVAHGQDDVSEAVRVSEFSKVLSEVLARPPRPDQPDISASVAPFFPSNEAIDVAEGRLRKTGFAVSRVRDKEKEFVFASKMTNRSHIRRDELRVVLGTARGKTQTAAAYYFLHSL